MSDQSNTPRAAVRHYDVFKHGIGTRVVELSTGRRGTVKDIRETAPEWIEPFIQWDDEQEISRARWKLLLAEDL